jgi:hypothetical protein
MCVCVCLCVCVCVRVSVCLCVCVCVEQAILMQNKNKPTGCNTENVNRAIFSNRINVILKIFHV